MRSLLFGVAALALILACACRTPQAATTPGDAALTTTLPTADAPYELADDQDLMAIRHRFLAMSPGDPAIAAERDAARDELVAEYSRRIDRALERGERSRAYETLREMVSLWHPRELRDADALAAALAPHRARAQAVFDSFARTGGDVEAAFALVVLAAAEPAARDEHLAELDLVFAFADDLAIALYGPGAVRARPIEILESLAEAFPSPAVIERLVPLYVARQQAIHETFKNKGADIGLVRAHGEGVLRSTWNVIRVVARADRIEGAPSAITGITGLGDDPDLRALLAKTVGPESRAYFWRKLGEAFEDEDPEKADDLAALRVYEAGIRRHPDDATLRAAAAGRARALENLPLSIRLFEEALERDPGDRESAAALIELYRIRLGQLAFNQRPKAASERLAETDAFLERAGVRWKDYDPAADRAAAYAAMGSGLVSLGELDEAKRFLSRSLELRPTFDALESIGTVALKLDRHAAAITVFERALQLPDDEVAQQFERAKMLRLAADAHDGAGDRARAVDYYRRALDTWDALRSEYRFSDRFQAELHIERGRSLWALGQQDMALRELELAVDTDPDGAQTHIAVVAFLIVRDQYERALDAYHRGLGSHEISDYHKVFMSLWVVTEARRTGIDVDPLAARYLARRDGRLWYDDLARLASGRAAVDDLEERANTRSRKAELLYYAAVLTELRNDPAQVERLLESVVATDMVLFFEYDMAKHWLANGYERTDGGAAASTD